VIGDGRILIDGPLTDLRERVLVERRITLDLLEPDEEVVDPAVRVIGREGARVHLSFDPTQVATTELISRLTARHAVRDLFVENPPIEEVIARLYGSNGVRA